MTPWLEFDAWMKMHKNNYLNDFGILFNRRPEFVFVDSPWPEQFNADILSIIILCANGKELFELLNFETVDDLEKLQQETVLNLFYAGHAMVLCTTPNDESLHFQKAGDRMIAIIDGVDLAHEVNEQLILPGDFIRYTNNYFRFMKEHKKNRPKNG
jgi:hypothetical protein